jgi:hypothetical protein
MVLSCLSLRQASAPLSTKEHETALRNRGLINVLWHGGSGDTVLGKLDDYGSLVGNVRYHTKKRGS